jgi:hypothetical protein
MANPLYVKVPAAALTVEINERQDAERKLIKAYSESRMATDMAAEAHLKETGFLKPGWRLFRDRFGVYTVTSEPAKDKSGCKPRGDALAAFKARLAALPGHDGSRLIPATKKAA